MVARALLLLLLVLNVGVAAWWLLRPADPPAAIALPGTAPWLRLAGELPVASASIASSTAASMPRAAATVAAAQAPAKAAAMRCVRLGPFASDAALAHAQSALQPLVRRMAVASVPASSHGWRVWLPPQASRDAAQAMATRIGAAGFSDYYVVPDGSEANSIALGRYGNAESAQRRQAQLQAAGFAAQAEALGAVTRWIDVESLPATDDAGLRAGSGAAQARALDCTRLH